MDLLTSKLDGVHPELVEKITRVMNLMAFNGHPMKVTDGLRTAQEQLKLYAKGRTADGHIVTYADGIIKQSNHQPRADNWGHAVDCAFEGDDPYSLNHPWTQYGLLVESEGLLWGGRFKNLVDLPHAEMK